MPSSNVRAGELQHALAMRDAAAGAFEAARVRYNKLLSQAESISIDYVYGRTDQIRVRTVAEQLLEAEFIVEEAARKTRLFQDAAEKMTRYAVTIRHEKRSRANDLNVSPFTSLHSQNYLEFSIPVNANQKLK